jgi:hypothetical protein
MNNKAVKLAFSSILTVRSTQRRSLPIIRWHLLRGHNPLAADEGAVAENVLPGLGSPFWPTLGVRPEFPQLRRVERYGELPVAKRYQLEDCKETITIIQLTKHKS